MINSILIFDKVSKSHLNYDINILMISGIQIVQSIDQIHDEQLEDAVIFLLDDYLTAENLLKIQLFKSLHKNRIIHLCQTDISNILFDEYMDHFMCNYKDLSVKLIQSALVDEQVRKSNDKPEIIKLVNKILESNQSSDLMVELANATNDLYLQHISTNEKYKKLIKISSDQESQIGALQNRLVKMSDEYVNLSDSVRKQSEILEKYDNIFSVDIINKIYLTKYPKAPKIIYLKEYQEIPSIHTFIKTLSQVLTLQYQKIVKSVVLFDSSDNLRFSTLPKYYKCLGSKYNTVEVVQNSYICKSGDYNKLFDFLLTNVEALDYLIVLDCKGTQDYIFNDLVVNLALCREYALAHRFNLDDSVLMVDDDYSSDLPENVMVWKNYQYEPDETEQYKFITLSSKDAIASMLDKIEQVFGGI